MEIAPKLIFIAVSLVLLLTGCSANEIQPDENSSLAPPHQLIFYNEDELMAFLDAPNLSDTELMRFLVDNSYSMNGIDSRERLDAIMKSITRKPFPVVKNAILTDVTVHVETNSLHARYETETGEVYSFKYGLQESLQDQKCALSYENVEIEGIFSIDADTPFTAAKIHNDEKNLAGKYFIETPDTIVLIRLFKMDAEEIEYNLQNIYFYHISNIGK